MKRTVSGILLLLLLIGAFTLTFNIRPAFAQAMPSSTSVYCSYSTVPVNASVSISAEVSGYDVTGNVTWTSNSSTGFFSSSVSPLSYGVTANIEYYDSSPGTVVITASYGGDSEYAPSNGSAILVVSAQAMPSSTSVYCSYSTVPVNASVSISAEVSGYDVTGNVTWTSNSSTGFFSPSVSPLFGGECFTAYRDSTAGTVVITASYGGDENNAPSDSSAVLEVSNQRFQSRVYVGGAPNPVHVTGNVTCYASVVGFDPTGNVTWTSNSSTGSFSSSVCTLSGGQCSTTYTDSSVGTVVITASYSGDSINAPSYGSTIFAVLQFMPSSTVVYSASSVITANWPIVFTATVTGLNPTGTITWSSDSSTGTFSSSICNLSSGTCSTSYRDSNPGIVTITATYSGDINNSPSSYNITMAGNGTLPSNETAFLISPSVELLTVGDSFTVTVNLTNAQNLFAWQAVLEYNGTDLRLNDMWIPDENVFAGYYLIAAGPVAVKETDGSSLMEMGAALQGQVQIAYVTNSVLCEANFTVLHADQSLIELKTVEQYPLDPCSFWINATPGSDSIYGQTAFGSECMVNAAAAQPPTASFTYSLPPSDAQDTVTFDASNSTSSDGTITSYCWNFGDSNVTTTGNPIITHTYSAGGAYNVTLTVTDTHGLAASASQMLTVYNHDVTVTNISADPGWIYEGQTAHVNVTVSNLGDFPENVWVTLYYNMTANKSVDAYPVYLDAQQSITLEFAWNTAGIPCLNYTLTAVAVISAGSNALPGGTINVRLMGDVNGDGRVDMKDIALVARAFGSTPTSSNWNPAADVNGDGVVNMKDIALVARNFGQHT